MYETSFTIEDETDSGDDMHAIPLFDIRRNPVRENLMLRHRMSLKLENIWTVKIL